jgi:PIN domain nuclease of toxin-antitoxin system
MRVLLDTHTLLWWFTNDDRLSTTARDTIGDDANDVLVSAASAWEIATKQRLGKLDEVPQATDRFAACAPAGTRLPTATPSTACWPPRASWSGSPW